MLAANCHAVALDDMDDAICLSAGSFTPATSAVRAPTCRAGCAYLGARTAFAGAFPWSRSGLQLVGSKYDEVYRSLGCDIGLLATAAIPYEGAQLEKRLKSRRKEPHAPLRGRPT